MTTENRVFPDQKSWMKLWDLLMKDTTYFRVSIHNSSRVKVNWGTRVGSDLLWNCFMKFSKFVLVRFSLCFASEGTPHLKYSNSVHIWTFFLWIVGTHFTIYFWNSEKMKLHPQWASANIAKLFIWKLQIQNIGCFDWLHGQYVEYWNEYNFQMTKNYFWIVVHFFERNR